MWGDKFRRVWTLPSKSKSPQPKFANRNLCLFPSAQPHIFRDRNIPSQTEGSWLCEIYRWHEPVSTRVLNPNASETRYKPKQRSYRKTWRGEILLGKVYLEPFFLNSAYPLKLGSLGRKVFVKVRIRLICWRMQDLGLVRISKKQKFCWNIV